MPNAVVLDSGPCVALFDRDDDYHEMALQFIRRQPGPLIFTLAVVTEVIYVLDFSIRAQVDFLSWVRSGAVQLVETDDADLQRVIQLMQKYSDLPMDFTDGLLVAICERLGTKQIATVDQDFNIYRWRSLALRAENPEGMLGAWCLVLGAWCLVLGAWCLVLGAWCLVLGAWFVVLSSWCLV